MLSKIIPINFRYWLIEHIFKKNIDLSPGKRAFIFLYADYGNIGDIAISKAQELFLSAHCPGYSVVAVPISKTRQSIRSIMRQVKNDDIITIVGGGNMGSMYPDIEALRQLVIQRFPENPIVCFPQSLDWDGSRESDADLERIASVYSKHRNLTVFARESVSYEKLRTLFSTSTHVKVSYSPDIVLSLKSDDINVHAPTERGRVLLCLRNDKERLVSDGERAAIEAAVTNCGEQYAWTDTHVDKSCMDEADSLHLLTAKLREFTSSKLVITDRLHGMILSVIAGTQCIVLPNTNHKIRQTYTDWLLDCPNVEFIEPADSSRFEKMLRISLQDSNSGLNTILPINAFSEIIESLNNHG